MCELVAIYSQDKNCDFGKIKVAEGSRIKQRIFVADTECMVCWLEPVMTSELDKK